LGKTNDVDNRVEEIRLRVAKKILSLKAPGKRALNNLIPMLFLSFGNEAGL